MINAHGADRLCGCDELRTCEAASVLKRNKGELFTGDVLRSEPRRLGRPPFKGPYEGGEDEAAQESNAMLST